MLKCTWTICRVMFCGIFGCCVAGSAATMVAMAAPAETKSGAAKAAPAHISHISDEQRMARMMMLATPSPNHEILKKFVGSWTTVTRIWTSPGEPRTSRGTAEYSMILGGRFVKGEHTGTFMDGPYAGFGLTGYDNRKGKFVAVWGDTLTTGLIDVDGVYDAATREMTFKGVSHAAGPATPYRMVTKLVDENHFIFSWYEPVQGKETRTMEIDYTRQ